MSTPDVRVQVPPRPPKKQSQGCFFFCRFRRGSTAQKILKALGFPTKTGIQGLLCYFSAILIYLSLFSTISVPNVGTPVGAPTRKHKYGAPTHSLYVFLLFPCGAYCFFLTNNFIYGIFPMEDWFKILAECRKLSYLIGILKESADCLLKGTGPTIFSLTDL